MIVLHPPFADEKLRQLHTQWQAEGWDIFLADGSIQNDNGRRPYQLQRIDEDMKFITDEDAWDYVVAQAFAGSEPHIDAMAFLKDCSPDEFAAMILRLPSAVGRTHGQLAYEEDVRRKPLHHDDTPRKRWFELCPTIQGSWERNPFPRIWPDKAEG